MNRRPWVAIQRNPRSGAGPRRRVLLDLASQLRRHGIRPRIFSRRQKLDERLAIERDGESLVCLVAAGGDGTVDDLVNRFPGVPLATLPLGTENLLARHLGVPRCGKTVADIIAAGNTRRYDLGILGDRRFVLMAGFGFDADVVHRLDAQRTGHIQRWTYLGPMWQAFRRYEFQEMRLYVDDATTPLTASVVMAVNLPVYAMGLPVAREASGQDGLLDLRLFPPKSGGQLLRYCLALARGKHEALPDVQCLRVTQVRVESDVPVPAQVDGDPAGWTPTTLRVLPSALEVFVPDLSP